MKWLTSRIRRLLAWVRRLPRKVSIPAGIVLLLGISVAGYFAVDFYSYMQHDPEFCQSCHIMTESWDRWASSDHAEVACHECHQQTMLESATQLFNFLTKDYDRIEKHATVQDEACEECHQSGDPNWLQVAATAGHVKHSEEENIACTRCHATTVHRFEPAGVICQLCHEGKHIEVEKMNDMHCAVCHDFLAEGDDPLPTRDACLDCHNAMPGDVIWSVDAPMRFDCGSCHIPHQQAEPLTNCETCHTVQGYHLKGAHQAADCVVCHDAHEWVVAPRETCLMCHPGQATHNAGVDCNACHQFMEG